ncbi:uncharacterized protein LOC143279977 [Babylonia areolata]|uniref:uncharacterized protein LOC143279977 n=1 Tax=Babylonia areolata TaxID=304850 RepID=UPI003FD21BC4
MAKAKRLNRNFCDMVEKANWQQEKKIGGLASDSSFVSIMEIPLKDLGSAGDRDPTRSQDYSAQASTDSSPHARRKQEGQEKKERHSRCMLVVGKGQSYQPNGRSGSRGGVDACQGSSTQSPTHDSFTTSIVSPTFLTLHPPLLSSSSSTLGSSVYHGALAKKRGESGGSPPSPSRPLSHFSLPTYATPIEERMSEPLPNGSLVRSRSYSERSHLRCDLDCQSHRKAADSLASHQRENRGELKNMCSIFSDNHGDLAVFLSRKVWEAKDNHATRVLLQKTRSYQDHLCFTDTWQQGLLEAERMTKEELLVLWRNSELELNRKLFEALKEKTRLEKKLAVMKDQPPT